jgi:hypothetical protein
VVSAQQERRWHGEATLKQDVNDIVSKQLKPVEHAMHSSVVSRTAGVLVAAAAQSCMLHLPQHYF